MKRIKYIVFSFLVNIVTLGVVYAAPSYSFNVSSSQIENGSKVTASVTVKQTAAWNVKITSAGNTSGCSNQWVGDSGTGANATKTFSVSCRATSTGVISFTLSGDITSSDGTNSNISGSKRVTVVEKRPDSTVNTLKSLSVSGYDLSPEFNEDTLEYSVSVPPTTTKVSIEATRKDNASKVEGTGEFEVNEGQNKFEIKVTAESGALRTYVVTINVEDSNPIYVMVDNYEYSILKTSRNLEIPSLYTESTINIDGNEVPCFKNEASNITLVALKNSMGEVGFFIYDNGEYTKYIELTGDNLIIYPSNEEINIKNFIAKDIKINDIDVKGYYYKDLDNGYYLIRGVNLSDGTRGYYLYNEVEKTFQTFDIDLINKMNDDNSFYMYALIGSATLIFLCLIIIIAQLNNKRKIRRVIASLEEKLNNKNIKDKKVNLDSKKENKEKDKNKNKEDKKFLRDEELDKLIDEALDKKDNNEEKIESKIEETGVYNILEDD